MSFMICYKVVKQDVANWNMVPIFEKINLEKEKKNTMY